MLFQTVGGGTVAPLDRNGWKASRTYGTAARRSSVVAIPIRADGRRAIIPSVVVIVTAGRAHS